MSVPVRPRPALQDGHGAAGAFCDVEELLDDVLGGRGAVDEVEVLVLDAALEEALAVVLLLVEADDGGDAELLEDGHVVFGCEGAVVVVVVLAGRGPREGHELARHDPVEVSVVHHFVVLVLRQVEGLVVVPLQLDRALQPLDAVEDLSVSPWRPTVHL